MIIIQYVYLDQQPLYLDTISTFCIIGLATWIFLSRFITDVSSSLLLPMLRKKRFTKHGNLKEYGFNIEYVRNSKS